MNSLYRTLASVALPACALLAAYLLVPRLPDLPASLAGLRVHGVYVLLALGIVLSLVFRRGRMLFALLSLTLAYVSYRFLLQHGLKNLPARTIFAALCVFVPLNLGVLSLLRERGIFNWYGLRRLAAILAQILFAAWVVYHGGPAITDAVYVPLIENTLFARSPIPQAGLAAMALGLFACIAAWFARRSPIDLGFAGAIVAFAIAANGIAAPDVFAAFTAAATLILIIAMLQDTFRMAFIDELTTLPSRRALNESLAGLGKRYTIAMLDVDHFKDFNDAYGHNTGDQVLKMVAAQLAHVGGGGRPYRYGGEEFTLLFPGKSPAQTLPYLEALRKNIARYEMAVRSDNRPAQTKSDRKQRSGRRSVKAVCVTVSIGVAERNGRLVTPEDVIRAADQALYRAKRGGRNRVAR